MIKIILGLLVLMNAVLYAYNAGHLGKTSVEGREPARMTSQLDPQRIRLVDAAVAPNPVKDSSAPTLKTMESAGDGKAEAIASEPSDVSSGPGTPPTTLTKTVAAASNEAAKEVVAPVCVEIGNFDAADARRFDTQIATLGSGARVVKRNVPEVDRHLVYIPSAGDKESADRKAAELRQLGIDDFYVIQDNSDLRWGISLGMFKTDEAARQHLATMAKQGVRGAKVGARSVASPKTVFQLRNLDASAQSALAKIRIGFPKQESRNCAS